MARGGKHGAKVAPSPNVQAQRQAEVRSLIRPSRWPIPDERSLLADRRLITQFTMFCNDILTIEEDMYDLGLFRHMLVLCHTESWYRCEDAKLYIT